MGGRGLALSAKHESEALNLKPETPKPQARNSKPGLSWFLFRPCDYIHPQTWTLAPRTLNRKHKTSGTNPTLPATKGSAARATARAQCGDACRPLWVWLSIEERGTKWLMSDFEVALKWPQLGKRVLGRGSGLGFRA